MQLRAKEDLRMQDPYTPPHWHGSRDGEHDKDREHPWFCMCSTCSYIYALRRTSWITTGMVMGVVLGVVAEMLGTVVWRLVVSMIR